MYKNCRNTINIADASLRLLNSPVKMRMYDGAVVGSSPCMAICSDETTFIQTLNNMIDLDVNSLMKDENKLAYVGASRARHELFMIASMNEEKNEL